MDNLKQFTEFMSGINLTDNQRKELITGHETLRKRLKGYDDLKDVIIETFLQGSYRRSTIVRPKGVENADVDIVVVTKLSEEEYSPKEALMLFESFLDKYYSEKWRLQNRSIGITLSYVDLDIVITSAPSEAEQGIYKTAAVTTNKNISESKDWILNEKWVDVLDSFSLSKTALLVEAQQQAEWKTEPLRIPDVGLECWDDTNPLEQMKITRKKNRNTNGNFVQIVKAVKWLRLFKYPDSPKPKGFPLERIIGEYCPDEVHSIPDGIEKTFSIFIDECSSYYNAGTKPVLPDYGVPHHDVLAKTTSEEFSALYEQISDDLEIVKKARECTDQFKSCEFWRKLFGNKFPLPPNDTSKGYTEPDKPANPPSTRFA